jgi:5-methyltetrahydrofolate--homocysteine methyltransferase
VAFKNILESLKNKEILIADGGMGTMLQEQGLKPGQCPELMCLENPLIVKQVYQAYKDAGSDISETNSFGGSSYKLKKYGLENRVYEINFAAAQLARQVAGESGHVMASVGPTGEFLEPVGEEEPESFYESFKEQIIALEKGGADIVIIETMTALDEAIQAVKAARENTALTVICSFTFDQQPNGSFASMMGIRPDRFAKEIIAAGAHIIGTNCGNGPDKVIEITTLLKQAVPQAFVLAMPNAGLPVLENGKTVFKQTPEQMALKVKDIVKAGASIIGGCCGTGPQHIAAIKQAVKTL